MYNVPINDAFVDLNIPWLLDQSRAKYSKFGVAAAFCKQKISFFNQQIYFYNYL
jgi:hypothetical protein